MTNKPPKSPERIRTEQLQERTFNWAKEILDLCPRKYDTDPSRSIFATIVRSTQKRLEAEREANKREKLRTDNSTDN